MVRASMIRQETNSPQQSVLRASSASSSSPGNWREISSAQPIRIDGPVVSRPWLELPGSISLREVKRRLWHMSPGLLPIVSYIVPHQDPLGPIFKTVALSIMVLITTSLLLQFKTVRRAGESTGLGAVYGYAFSTILMLLLFPGHAELGMLVLCVLAFGDGMATTCGLLFQGPRLPWNPQKTWTGTLAFVTFGGVASSLAYWAESRPQASWSCALTCGFTAAVLAALAESLPSRINDNVRVGVASAVTALTAHALVVGL